MDRTYIIWIGSEEGSIKSLDLALPPRNQVRSVFSLFGLFLRCFWRWQNLTPRQQISSVLFSLSLSPVHIFSLSLSFTLSWFFFFVKVSASKKVIIFMRMFLGTGIGLDTNGTSIAVHLGKRECNESWNMNVWKGRRKYLWWEMLWMKNIQFSHLHFSCLSQRRSLSQCFMSVVTFLPMPPHCFSVMSINFSFKTSKLLFRFCHKINAN